VVHEHPAGALLQQRAGRVFVHHAVVDYVVRLVIATREPAEFGMADVASWVSYGASPRASLGMIAAGRALALLRGRDYVLPQDILDVAIDVLPHRMVLSYDAIADGITASQATSRVLQTIALPQVAPRQRAGGGYLAPAASPAPQAVTAPGRPGGYPNGAHAAVPPTHGAPPQAHGAPPQAHGAPPQAPSGLPQQQPGSGQQSWGPST